MPIAHTHAHTPKAARQQDTQPRQRTCAQFELSSCFSSTEIGIIPVAPAMNLYMYVCFPLCEKVVLLECVGGQCGQCQGGKWLLCIAKATYMVAMHRQGDLHGCYALSR